MYLITGAGGQLGQSFKAVLGADAYYVNRQDLDITDLIALNDFLKKHTVTAIINCAAYTQVDVAEDEQDQAAKINVLGAKNLAQMGIPLVHFSTDYVFDGQVRAPYTETTQPHPLNVYGQTKLAGENAVLENADIAVIIRTSWLYSEFGSNFLRTMCRLFVQKDTLNIVDDQIGTPTYTGHLVAAVLAIIPQMNKGNKGIYHFSNEGVASWYDFACEIRNQSGVACTLSPIPSSRYPTKAERPKYSVLDKSKIKNTFGVIVPKWETGVLECLKRSSIIE